MNLKFLRKISLPLLLMLMASTMLFAQDRKVTGKVVDQADGQGIPGVNVSLKGIPSNVSTNADGNFTIQVKSDADVLVFSYIGYVRQQIAVGAKTTLTVRLVSENKDLDDVVVVGYGTQKRATLTGSVVDIKASEIEDLPGTNVAAALSGRLLGVGVSGGIARPGVPAKITIRNPNAIFSKDGGSTDPLYVIDGVIQIDGQGKPDATNFGNLDASEIETMSFLKDASAAIYGTRGGNGVVLITTKRGRVGKPRISYSGSYAVNDEAYRTKMMSAYQFGQYMNILNGANSSNPKLPGVDNFFSNDELEYFKTIDYDRLEDAWKSASDVRHTLSVSGGADKATFFASASYNKQNGNLATLDYDRWNFRAGTDVTVATNFKVGVQLSGNSGNLVKTFNKVSGEGVEDDYKNLLLAPRYVPDYVNGLPVKLPGTTNDLSRYHFGEINRLNNLATTKSNLFSVNVYAEYELPYIKGLKARLAYARNAGNSVGDQVGTFYTLYEFNRLGENKHIYEGSTVLSSLKVTNGDRLYYSNTNQKSEQTNFVLNYARDFGKHSVSGLFTVEKSESENAQQVVFKASPIAATNGQFNSATGAIDGSTSANEAGSLSYVGRANYAYANKYLAEFLFRSDASTKFAPENYWGKFYSGSVGWVISEESFFKVPAVNYLKLRYAFGVLGNDQTKAWLWRQRYTFQDGKGGVFGGNSATTAGFKMEAAPNRDATWSTEYKNNIGIDAKFLKNRLGVTVEGYYNLARNILIEPTASLPVTVGGTVASINMGSADYFGYELGISWDDKIGKDFNYGVSARFGWSDDKVKVSNFNANDILKPWMPKPGESSDNGMWGYDYLGMFKTQDEVTNYINQNKITQVFGVAANQLKPGTLYYRDVRGPLQSDGSFAGPDGIIDENDQVQLSKKATNHYGFGITLKAGYKGFSVDAVIAGSFGGWSEIDERKPLNASIARNFTSLPDIWGSIYDPAINPGGVMPNPSFESINLTPTSNFYKVNAMRIRIPSFNVNYSIPKIIVEKLKINNARVFVSALNPVNLYNPYTYKGPDGAWDAYPNLRTLSFGVNLTL
ncbi:SusC/RagA family TonB-linked outer membrane protein [Pedobacter alluvionis]|uniref:SusC/RagA family TonB-linked outer membrane protein n=1 Tax=Pedobacter alluvionis TaxID=475253 RepID=A0A497XWS6_9SPHI|nr:SusC/RagA family TonB-linked outer membrane protein [Pedobacter alluvionis]RLJ74642.1 TonB-linked SusC/RagA family outer membrane protein [Pedobacter alluvionis]TFB29794.1 SusC/RagA family TonB-linked outer membrane protein [Pedobacter alluvionis]